MQTTDKKPKLSTVYIAVSMVALLTLGTSVAHADNFWSQTGAQCVVDDPSHANSLYSRTSGGIKFAAGKTGTIGLFCSISKNTGASNPNVLVVTYQDTDFTNSATRVMARLFRMPRFGSFVSLTQIGADITSASPQIVGTSDNWMVRSLGHTFDFENHLYFVYLELTRTSTAQQAILYGVALDNFIE